MRIEFTVPAVPIAQPRQRHRVLKMGDKTIVQNFTPKTAPVQSFKASVRMAAQQAYRGAPIPGAISVALVFVFPRTKGQLWKKRPMPRMPHVKKPDSDNLAKVIFDGLNGLTWLDDAQVCQASIEKWIAAGDEQPHVRVAIEEL